MLTAIFIPARMESVRLPGKPLADINGKPMIVRVLQRAAMSQVKDIYVACAEQEIADAVQAHGGKAILTDPTHPSGTDRIYEALKKTGKQYDFIVNVQGDLPALDPTIIDSALAVMEKFPGADIATLAAPVQSEEEADNPNVVKAVASMRGENFAKAIYFSRSRVPYGEGTLLHHIGLYVFRRQALEKFVKLPTSPLEKRERLEQLRALENDMNIYLAITDAAPHGVDTPEDLEKIRKQYA